MKHEALSMGHEMGESIFRAINRAHYRQAVQEGAISLLRKKSGIWIILGLLIVPAMLGAVLTLLAENSAAMNSVMAWLAPWLHLTEQYIPAINQVSDQLRESGYANRIPLAKLTYSLAVLPPLLAPIIMGLFYYHYGLNKQYALFYRKNCLKRKIIRRIISSGNGAVNSAAIKKQILYALFLLLCLIACLLFFYIQGFDWVRVNRYDYASFQETRWATIYLLFFCCGMSWIFWVHIAVLNLKLRLWYVNYKQSRLLSKRIFLH